MKIVRLLCFMMLVEACLTSPSCSPSPPANSAKFKVGIAYSTAGKHDNSYSQSAALGIDLAKKSRNIDVSEVEPAQLSDLEPTLAALSRARCKLVIAIGFYYIDAVRRVSNQFPDVKFLIIDGEVGDLQNVRSVLFKEEQGSYLVGAIAGLKTAKKKIGIVLAVENPVMNKFVAGYRCGATAVGLSADAVKANYIGSGPDAFTDPLKGAEVARSEIVWGADVIFQVAAASGSGVIAAAKEAGIFAIGVDSDQSSQAPGTVLTSMLKRVDLAVEDGIDAAMQGHFSSGIVRKGLETAGRDYVDYVYNDSNQQLISGAIRQRVETLRALMKAGRIVVPQTASGVCGPQ